MYSPFSAVSWKSPPHFFLFSCPFNVTLSPEQKISSFFFYRSVGFALLRSFNPLLDGKRTFLVFFFHPIHLDSVPMRHGCGVFFFFLVDIVPLLCCGSFFLLRTLFSDWLSKPCAPPGPRSLRPQKILSQNSGKKADHPDNGGSAFFSPLLSPSFKRLNFLASLVKTSKSGVRVFPPDPF